MLRVRRTNDTELIKELDEQIFDYTKDDPVSIFGNIWWVVYDNDVPVAFAGAKEIYGDQQVYLSRAGVLPSHRGMKIQQRLIKARVAWAKKIGATQAITYTMPYNLPSANNLIKCGFLLYTPNWKWGGNTALYWVRKL